MTLLTLVKYLLGNREAILAVARSRQSLWVGLLFVFAAGFAREYDGADLLHEPWHLLLPLGASLASSAVLYALVRGIAWRHGAQEPTPLAGYLDFLGLYWLTAPLALVYAIPVERFLSAADATRANLWLLGLVALWRVVLMVRVVSVLYRISFFTALFIVMLFADSVTVVLLGMMRLPIVGMMGGIRLSESEAILHDTVFTIRLLAILSWPAWLIAALVQMFRKQPEWQYQPAFHAPFRRVSSDLWTLAGLVVAMWIVFLPYTQPEQQLRRRVEQDLRAGRIREGLEAMSSHERGDFPPFWDPPPRIAYRERVPDITDVQEHLDVLPIKPWVREIFVAKFGNWLRGEYDFGVWGELSTEEVERRLALIERMPECDVLVRDHQEELKMLLYQEQASELAQRVRKLLAGAGVRVRDAYAPAENPEDDAATKQQPLPP